MFLKIIIAEGRSAGDKRSRRYISLTDSMELILLVILVVLMAPIAILMLGYIFAAWDEWHDEWPRG